MNHSNFTVIPLKVNNNNRIQAIANNSQHDLPDPSSNSGYLELDRFLPSSLYAPFLLLQSKYTKNYYLLFLRKDKSLRKDNSNYITIWAYSSNFVYLKEDNVLFETMVSFFAAQPFLVDPDWHKYINENIPFWPSVLNRFYSNLRVFKCDYSKISKTEPFFVTKDNLPSIFLETLFLLENNWRSNPKDLFAAIDHTNQELIAKSKKLYYYLIRDVEKIESSDPWFNAIKASLPLALAKDIIFSTTGKHYAKSPATGNWIPATQQLTVQCLESKRTFRLFRYVENFAEFIELKDFGFIGASTFFLLPWFPNTECPPLGKKYSYVAWWFDQQLPEHFWEVAIEKLRKSPTLNSSPSTIIAVNCSPRNLGHTIWNDINGLIAWFDGHEAVGLSKQKQILEPINVVNPFSDLNNQQLFKDFVNYHFDNEINWVTMEKCPELPSTCFLQNVGSISPLHIIINKTRQKAIADFFQTKSDNSKLPQNLTIDHENFPILLINVRGGNKMLLNLAECLQKTYENLSTLNKKPIILLEGSSKDYELINNVRQNLEYQNIFSHILLDLNAYQLHAAFNLCTIVVAPVGSALVIPTWIMNKYCVAHGDPMHMDQLNWWSFIARDGVKSLTNNIFAVPLSSIKADDPNKIYSNYKIDSTIFSDTVINTINKAQDSIIQDS
jgi:hypothetical protein